MYKKHLLSALSAECFVKMYKRQSTHVVESQNMHFKHMQPKTYPRKSQHKGG